MTDDVAKPANPKLLTWLGWALTLLSAAGLSMSAVMKVKQPYPPEMVKQMEFLDWELDQLPALAVTEGVCTLLYLIPQTAVLGAILLTGYLGGAVATHVRMEDGFAPPVIIGVLVWLGIFLREPRLRALLPWRRKPRG